MKVTFKGKEYQTIGNPPFVNEEMPNFAVTNKNDQRVSLEDLLGKTTLISVVPDINTSVCSIQTKTFNKTMDQFSDVNFLTISTNTVEEQQKWCAAEGVKNMQLMSDRSHDFGKATELLIEQLNILARSVWIIDKDGKIVYREIVDEIVHEPNYEKALTELKNL
ncbi:thiol peroxidase [Lactobacillus agrestimuris]|uniref:thiol peroxidase n=1 Tax=Lactobacillus agrestimuris TaxID=2941328 RepID=UPI0020434BEC|nr:thiol peroxidase [Lactobacillus agrestimuris]